MSAQASPQMTIACEKVSCTNFFHKNNNNKNQWWTNFNDQKWSIEQLETEKEEEKIEKCPQNSSSFYARRSSSRTPFFLLIKSLNFVFFLYLFLVYVNVYKVGGAKLNISVIRKVFTHSKESELNIIKKKKYDVVQRPLYQCLYESTCKKKKKNETKTGRLERDTIVYHFAWSSTCKCSDVIDVFYNI